MTDKYKDENHMLKFYLGEIAWNISIAQDPVAMIDTARQALDECNVKDITHKTALCAKDDTLNKTPEVNLEYKLRRDINAVTILYDRGDMDGRTAIEKIKALLREHDIKSEKKYIFKDNPERDETEKNTPENIKNDPNGTLKDTDKGENNIS